MSKIYYKDKSVQKSFNGIHNYIEFMDNEYYPTPKHKNKNNIKDTTCGSVTICIGDYDVYGQIQYKIALYDWLTGDWLKGGHIKYLEKRAVIRTKSNKPTSTKLISSKGVDDLNLYLLNNDCSYLL